MNEIKKLIELLLSLVLDFLFIVSWLFFSWIVHHFLMTAFAPEGVQFYKFIIIEGFTDISVFLRLYRHFFTRIEKSSSNKPWWY